MKTKFLRSLIEKYTRGKQQAKDQQLEGECYLKCLSEMGKTLSEAEKEAKRLLSLPESK